MKIRILLCLLILSAGVVAQSTQGYVTVHVYRRDKDPFEWSFIFTRAMRVSLREASLPKGKQSKIAALRNKRYLTLKLAPGDYLLNSTGVDDFSVKVVAGEEIFIRFDPGEHDGCNSGSLESGMCPETRGAEVEIVPPGEARVDLSKLKPAKPSDIKDGKFVIVPKTSGT